MDSLESVEMVMTRNKPALSPRTFLSQLLNHTEAFYPRAALYPNENFQISESIPRDIEYWALYT